MKQHRSSNIIVVLFLLLFINNCQNKDIDMAKFAIEEERVRPGTDTVGIEGTYDFAREARSMKIHMGLDSTLSDASSQAVTLLGKDYSVTVRGLHPGTTYYYRYSADFGMHSDLVSETRHFVTSEQQSYRISVSSDPGWGGEVTGGGTYEEGQTCTVSASPSEGYVFAFWKESEIPVTQDSSYTFEVQESRILVARFAEIAALPVVITGEVSGIGGTSAMGSGEVTGEGGSEVTERGVCWATGHVPTTSDSHAGNGSGTGAFMAEMTGLSLGTTYRVRAYAVNSEGTAYGEEKSFTTLEHQEYTVSVSASPTSGGTVEGGGSYEEGESCTVRATAASGYNFVNWTEDGNQVSSSASYTFTVEGDRALVANFTAGTYVISVSVNPENGGTITGAGGYENGQSCTLRATANSGYTFTNWTENGSQVSTNASYTFTVTANRTLVANFTQHITLPTVTTSQVTNITETAATGGGNVTSDGGATVTARGVCWSTSHNPTTSDSHGTSGSGLGSYTCLMTNLTPNTTYYIRAYATNSQGTAYGDEVSFTTTQLPTFTINVSANPTAGGSVSGGGTYQQGQSCTVTATANNGYNFVNWTENDNQVSTNASYTFTVTANRTMVANFEQQAPQNYTITVSANPADGGTVSGGGTYQQGQSCTVTAEANRSSSFYYDFDDSQMPAGWTTIDGGSPTGFGWRIASLLLNNTGFGHNGSSDCVLSQSYDNTYGVIYPDNYLISPAVALANGSQFSFWACAQDASYPAEHFGVFVSTTGTNASDFTIVQEWTMTAKSFNGTRAGYRGNRDQGAWYQYTVDLSAYAGEGRYIAIRHFNCSDMYCIVVDDVELTGVSGYEFVNWTENGNVVSTTASYTFSVNNNRNLVANFTQQASQNYHISVSASPSNGGTVSGGGTYQQGQSCTVHATENSGYTFANWTENGNVVATQANYSFTVNGNRSLVANFTYNGSGNAPTGAINGRFTINASGDQVYFSQGNLQYRASTNTWRFAESQWDYVGEDNSNISETYSGWIDLFGWGTSGYHDSSDPYNVNYHPWATSSAEVNATYNKYGYGPSTNMPSPNLTGSSANYDWGVYNRISNGGNSTNTWRTLTSEYNGEWKYVFDSRSASALNGVENARYAKAKVANVHGVILFPDEYAHPSGVTLPVGINQADGTGWYGNNYSVADFLLMQDAGAVFLPAAGNRSRTSVYEVGTWGEYWSTSYANSSDALAVGFRENDLDFNGGWGERHLGLSVRLVCPAQ